jgi:hypothetical protein
MLSYRVTNAEGKRVEHNAIIGLVGQFREDRDAWREVDRLGFGCGSCDTVPLLLLPIAIGYLSRDSIRVVDRLRLTHFANRRCLQPTSTRARHRTLALTMAGYVSDVTKWTKLEEHWQQILSAHNIMFFHMTDCVSFRGEFANWRDKPDVRKRVINDLTECARRFTNKRFSASVVIHDYNRVDAEYQLHEHIGHPYSLCGTSCIEHVRTWARNRSVEANDITFVFEAGDEHKGDFQEICQRRFGIAPLFRLKKDVERFRQQT